MTHHEPVENLLASLHGQSVRIWADGGQLRCSGPETALTRDVMETIRERKADILMFLRSSKADGERPDRAISARNDHSPPLSFAQQRLWFVDQMFPKASLHHMAFAVEALGPLDTGKLRGALSDVAARHSVLRARIRSESGVAVQSIASDPSVPLKVVDLTAAPPPDQDLETLIRQEARTPFDLALQPPLRLMVIALEPRCHRLLLTLHHICADGWSVDVLLHDLAHFYAARDGAIENALEPLPIQYGDFAAWQRQHLGEDRLHRALAFWKDHLGTPLPVTKLPTDFPRPAIQQNEGKLYPFKIDAATMTRLREISAREQATLFATLFTAFAILISRYTGQPDPVIGTPVANRHHRETENLIGLFVNPLPVHPHLRPAAGFRENLRQVQNALWAVQEYQDLPFEKLVEELQPERDLSQNPLFQFKFQLDGESRQSIRLPGLELRKLPRQDGIAKLDLGLNMQVAEDSAGGVFEYSTALFRDETIAALGDHFVQLLKSIAAAPEKPIAGLQLLPEADLQRQLRDWNDTARPNDPAICFQTVFEQRAAETPDATALLHVTDKGVESLTYGDLNRRANRLAHLLRRRGVGPETKVGIALERGMAMVTAWLAVLKAGGAYLPLDTAYPAERIQYMLEDSGTGLVLSQSHLELPAVCERIDLDRERLEAEPDDNPESVSRPDHLAYVIYTSGSTGRPKGVLVEHGGLVNLTLDKIRVCDVRPDDCVLQFFSFSFDASIPELVMALGAGARLLLLPPEDVIPSPRLAEHIVTHGVTHITMTPSALLALPQGDYPLLRMVLVGGEAPSPELIGRWGGSRLFINAYGPTETTVNASMVACGNGHPVEATLRPSANKQLHVLDGNLEPLPLGIAGELHIGGTGIARGYHGRPALTADRFVPDPFAQPGKAGVLYRTGDRACQLPDGRIRVLGRLDDQVKIRGYRIEPGEIEAVLLGHSDVAAVTVTVKERNRGEKRVVAYAVSANDTATAPEAMRSWLKEKLPRYLVPDAFVWLDALPLTVNGKIDSGALPLPDFAGHRNGRPPKGPTEEAIALAFTAVLEKSGIAATDDFFELGGHSLLATRLAALAKETSGLDISVLDIFNAPSVEALAQRLDARAQEAGDRSGPAAGSQDDDKALFADLDLDSIIRPPAHLAPACPPKCVFLTGATGFLGAYLLHELLRTEDREVWCLVRGEDGPDRLRGALQDYGLWDPAMADRLHAVSGDLAEPGLGLDDAVYADLVERADAIVHNGATVHHLHSYERLRAANVEGTMEILRLACAGMGRPLHHVSSLSALNGAKPGQTIGETDRIDRFAPPASGYNRSKWAAEYLVEQCRRRGLPVTVYRPGAISGDSVSGRFNGADILCRLMQGYLRSGIAPEGDTPLAMLPVDHVARAITRLVDHPGAPGQIFHLVHSAPVPSGRLFEACNLEGLQIRRVPRAEWREHLDEIARSDPQHPLYSLVGLFEAPPARKDSGGESPAPRRFEAGSTHAFLKSLKLDEPALDTELFRKYLRAFVDAGALQTPTSKDQAP